MFHFHVCLSWVQGRYTPFLYVHSWGGPLPLGSWAVVMACCPHWYSVSLGFIVFLESPDILSWGRRKFFSMLTLLPFFSVIEFCKSLSVKECFLISTWNPPFVRSCFYLVFGLLYTTQAAPRLSVSLACVYMHMSPPLPELQPSEHRSLPTPRPCSIKKPIWGKVDFSQVCSWTEPYLACFSTVRPSSILVLRS